MSTGRSSGTHGEHTEKATQSNLTKQQTAAKHRLAGERKSRKLRAIHASESLRCQQGAFTAGSE